LLQVKSQQRPDYLSKVLFLFYPSTGKNVELESAVLMTVRDISKTYVLRTLFRGLSLVIEPGERIGVIGPNGAGKSTLMKILAGLEAPDEGLVVGEPGLRAVYVPQDDHFEVGSTPRQIVTDAARISVVVHDEHEAEILAGIQLGKAGFDESNIDSEAHSLSGGWRKRLTIARALAMGGGDPELIMLDEPTNHLDLQGIRWLETIVQRSAGTGSGSSAIFVTHDRAFLESVATRVIEISDAYPGGMLSVRGNYTEFLRRKQEYLDSIAKEEQVLSNQVRKDLEWLSRGPQGRQTKAKGRIDASYDRMRDLDEVRARNIAAGRKGAGLDFNASGRKTKKLLVVKGISKSFGENHLFRELDLTLSPGSCVGLLGPNGSGKTTLIRVLTGKLDADKGSLKLADPIPEMVLFSQYREMFDPNTPLREALSPGAEQVSFRGNTVHITAWAKRFLFKEEQLDQPVKSLSGGELARIHIASIMLQPADVLVLDEPTNDLDIPTLEILEEALEEFPGALILVTHDRAMLDRLATTYVALDGKGASGAYASLSQALNATLVEKPKPEKKSSDYGLKPTTKRGGLTYHEKREYANIEGDIAQAELLVEKAQLHLADPLVSANHTKMTEACSNLDEAQKTVEMLYSRWEELEAKA
jgi:ATP-binding cassette subfamily F protein uup